MGTNVTTALITCPQNPNETLGIKLPFLVMIIKNVSIPSFSLKSTSLSKCRCSMTKTSGGDSGPRTTSQPPESSPLSAPCPWDSTKAGIKFSLICLISPEEPMEATILRPLGSLSMPIAESEEYIFLIDFIVRRNFPLNSSFFYPSKSSNDLDCQTCLYLTPYLLICKHFSSPFRYYKASI